MPKTRMSWPPLSSGGKNSGGGNSDFSFDFSGNSPVSPASPASPHRLEPPVLARPPKSVLNRIFRSASSSSSSSSSLSSLKIGATKLGAKKKQKARAPSSQHAEPLLRNTTAETTPRSALRPSSLVTSVSAPPDLSSSWSPPTSSRPPPEIFAICVDTRKDTYRDFETDAILNSFQSAIMIHLENGIRRGLFGKGSHVITGFCASSELDLSSSISAAASSTGGEPHFSSIVGNNENYIEDAIESLSTLSYIEVPRSSFLPSSNCSYLTSMVTKVSKLQIDRDLKAEAARKIATTVGSGAAVSATSSSSSSNRKSKQNSVVRFFNAAQGSPPESTLPTRGVGAVKKSILGGGHVATAQTNDDRCPALHIRLYCPILNLVGGGGVRGAPTSDLEAPLKEQNDEDEDSGGDWGGAKEDELLDGADVYESALKKFVATCVRTLSSPRVKSLTLVVVRSSGGSSLSMISSSKFFRALKDAIFNEGASLDNFALEVQQDTPHAFDLSMRSMIRGTLPVLTTTFLLPDSEGDVAMRLDVCPAVLPVERRGTDIIGAGRAARETYASHLDSSSLKSMAIVQLLDSRKVDASVLWGIPLLATPSRTMASSHLEFKTSCTILGELCSVLLQDHLCMLLRTEVPNAETGFNDYYIFVPQSHCKSAILTKCATADQFLVDDELQHGEEGLLGDIEKAAYRNLVETSLGTFVTSEINPLALLATIQGSGAHVIEDGEDNEERDNVIRGGCRGGGASFEETNKKGGGERASERSRHSDRNVSSFPREEDGSGADKMDESAGGGRGEEWGGEVENGADDLMSSESELEFEY